MGSVMVDVNGVDVNVTGVTSAGMTASGVPVCGTGAARLAGHPLASGRLTCIA
jgi:hypothetical protein